MLAFGSIERLFQDSKICFRLLISLPALIRRLNVPLVWIVFVTSHLILSVEPDISNPFCPVGSATPPVKLAQVICGFVVTVLVWFPAGPVIACVNVIVFAPSPLTVALQVIFPLCPLAC